MAQPVTLVPESTELPTIYRSGDLVLQNPQETCVIFVSVILVSALLEYVLQRITSVENRYARILVNTMTQEITIVGVLALFLMFTVSVIPRRFITPLYVSLFTWANISLFFMAAFFVMIILFQFAWAVIDTRRWKNFEEGPMETEELAALSYRARIYKLLFEVYRTDLNKKADLTTQQLPFVEYISTVLRKQLVRVSDLSYRTWLSLSFIVLVNLIRAKLTPWLNSGEESVFGNAIMYVSVVGFGTVLVFLAFFALLQYRLNAFAYGRSQPSNCSELIPFGKPKRGLEFLQILIMSFNWYMTLFVTGNAKQISELKERWRLGLIYSMFLVPILIFLVLLPWTFYSIALLSTIGNMTNKEATKIHKRFRGEYEQSDDDDDDDDDDGPKPVQKADEKKSEKQTSISDRLRARSRSIASSASGTSAGGRPVWLEDDDDWDGTRTYNFGQRQRNGEQLDGLYCQNVDLEKVKTLLNTIDPHDPDCKVGRVIPKKDNKSAGSENGPKATEVKAPGVSQRPVWLDDDEQWDGETM